MKVETDEARKLQIYLNITKRIFVNQQMNKEIEKLTDEAKDNAVSQMLGVFGNRLQQVCSTI